MPTTTIRIEDRLKARIAAAAERAGKTPHAFMLDAIAQTLEQSEQEEAFDRLAEERWANILATGQSIPWDDARAWLEERSHGGKPARPGPRKIDR